MDLKLLDDNTFDNELEKIKKENKPANTKCNKQWRVI